MPIENLFTTRIGSHAWGMNHSESDIDLFRVHVVSTKDLLCGSADVKSRHLKLKSKDGTKIDCHVHEVGTLVYQLLKGNVNFVLGVMSPWVEKSTGLVDLLSLKQITEENVGKSIYHSVRGLGVHNYDKYIVTEKDTSPKKCNTILRTLEFAIRYLDTGKFKFEAVESGTPETVMEGIYRLDRAVMHSRLPASPRKGPFKEWLYGVRLSEWEKK